MLKLNKDSISYRVKMWFFRIISHLTTVRSFKYLNTHLPLALITLCAFFNGNNILPLVCGFNIDVRYPIIIKTVPDGFGGGPNPINYFGASVSFLKPEQGGYSWVIIGAPKANSPQHPDIPEPGAIWQCTLGREPVEICRPVVMDPTGNLHDGKVHEWKNGSLLGGPNGMALNSKNFVACASRLERWVDGRSNLSTISYMHGSCYVKPRSHLLLQDRPPNEFQRLNPLQDGKYEGKRKDRNGQAGFAVHFSKSGNELVMSAPGLERWMGSVIQYVSRDGGEKFTKSFVSEASKCSDSGLGCFNYLGYSLTSGYFYERDVSGINNGAPVYYAAGAPRANDLTGKVVVFRFPDPNDSRGALDVQQEIFGNQTGAYFGSSLLSLDLNGDGFDDLVVGSPRFSRDQRAQLRGRGGPFAAPLMEGRGGFDRFGGYGDEGAVFVYYSSNQGRGILRRQEIVLRGGNRPWSHFGTSMVSLGDLNRDGFNDFAVSAPFEDTSGAVYIYFGNSDGFIKEYAQVILGKSIDSTLGGFGFSLAGTEDIDNNGFNDIAIGSFNSSQVVILRTKPIITVYGAIKASFVKLPLDTNTFQIESCVSIQGDFVTDSVPLTISLQADANFQPRRVQIGRDNKFGSLTSSYFEYRQTISQSDGEICSKLYAIVTEPLESSGAPIVFSQTISLPHDSDAVKPRKMNIPSRGDGEDMYTSGAKFSDFCKTCPLINSRKPRSFELQLPLAIPCGDDDRCQSDLHLEVNFKGVDLSSGRFLVGSSPNVSMEILLSNRNETAIQPAVLVTWWKLKLKRNPADCLPESERGTEITYKCKLGKLLEKGQTASVSLEFDLTSLMATESGHMDSELFWNVTALTVSEMEKPVSESVVFPLSYQADPHIEASRRLEVFNAATLAKYFVFTQKFELDMDGPSPVADLMAVFQLPVNLTSDNNKETIVNVRSVDVDVSGGGGVTKLSCKPTKGHFSKNSDALISDYDDEDEDPDFNFGGIGGILPIDKDVSRGSNSTLVEKDRLLLHCNSPHVSCMEVACKVVTVYNPGTTTVITFVIDIASEDIRQLMKTHKVSSVQIESKGSLILSSMLEEIQPQPNKPDEATAITFIEKEGHKPISKWIYILAVVIGILILVCFGFCLYACGCFEDKHPPKGDAIDAVDGDISGEEMQPLHDKQEGDEKSDDDDDEEKRNRMSQPISPFSDVIDPPDFVPTEPTIPEEPENEERENKNTDRENAEREERENENIDQVDGELENDYEIAK